MEIIGLILAIIYIVWLTRLINFGTRTATQININTAATAASLAVLVEAMTPEAKARAAAKLTAQLETERQSQAGKTVAKKTKGLGFALGFVGVTAAIIIGLSLFAAYSARADDHVIRPTCWEENVNGEVHRNCEVKRNQVPPVSKEPQEQPPPPPGYSPSQPPPMAYRELPYPGYQSTLPPRYWPGVPQQGRNWANPCTPYVCGYGSPYGYGYPQPYYYGPGPGIVFGFGPFSVIVP